MTVKASAVGALVAAAWLGLAGCGGGGQGMPSARVAAPDSDRDVDAPGAGRDTDQDERLTWGSPVSSAETEGIAALLKRYYAVAAAGKGAVACSLLYRLAAETLLEEYDRRERASLRGAGGCARMAVTVFRRNRRELASDATTLEVTEARVRGNHGKVRLRFVGGRERVVLVQRDEGVWKMGTLVDDRAP